MNERSIPEILGWEPAADDWGYVDRYFQHPTAGYAVNEHGGWSVDDLLAWIGRSSPWDIAGIMPNDGDWAVVLCLKADDAESDEHNAPTILEALEAAVRAIDAEEPQASDSPLNREYDDAGPK